MSWTVIKERPHDCVKPERETLVADRIGTGSIWQCDTCNQEWELVFLGDVLVDWSRVFPKS